MSTFEAFPKIPRLYRDIVITEKIDGTNAAVLIEALTLGSEDDLTVNAVAEGRAWSVTAQSRSRIITPDQDNYGFARWVEENATELVRLLGPGRHFGEWWGRGIQRGYGLSERRFSLFNTVRHVDRLAVPFDRLPELGVVPVLYEGRFSEAAIQVALYRLRKYGSVAAPGFDRPEGIVVYHKASNHLFKVTLEGDEAPKGVRQ